MAPLLHLFYYAAGCGAKPFFTTGIYDRIGCDSSGGVSPKSIADIFTVVGNIVKILIEAAGVFAVIFIIIGGLFYIISMGEPSRMQRAKGIITQAIIGLVVVLLSFTVVSFVSGQF